MSNRKRLRHRNPTNQLIDDLVTDSSPSTMANDFVRKIAQCQKRRAHTHTHTHNIFIPFHLYFWLLIKTDLSRWICEVVFAERRNQKGEGG